MQKEAGSTVALGGPNLDHDQLVSLGGTGFFETSDGLEVWGSTPGKVLPGTVTEWEVSQSFTGSEATIDDYPADLVESASWLVAVAESTGRLNLAVSGGIAAGVDIGLKLARFTVRSDGVRRVRLNYGFSDRASVFLNGELVLIGDNTYLSRSGRYLGVMTLDNDALVLTLRDGDNELLFAVTEAFGGWGVGARLTLGDGLTLIGPKQR